MEEPWCPAQGCPRGFAVPLFQVPGLRWRWWEWGWLGTDLTPFSICPKRCHCPPTPLVAVGGGHLQTPCPMAKALWCPVCAGDITQGRPDATLPVLQQGN